MQKWKKLGLIIDPRQSPFPEFTYTALPVAEPIENEHLRVYFSARDKESRSITRSAVIDLKNNFKLIEWDAHSVIEPGVVGNFDDSGSMATCLFRWGDQDFLYYIGWTRSVLVPFRNALGLAIRRPGETTFSKAFSGPILDRSPFDASFVASCCVVPHGKQMIMYYLSCDGWEEKNGKLEHRYNIKIAYSDDGITWARRGQIAIDYADAQEYAISAPRVIVEDGRWKMWFSCRGSKYKIAYAESADGIDWQRLDHEMENFNNDNSDFDADMNCYPCLFDWAESRYMLYNGNGYGRSGVGLAVLED
jgi:hypothetical protein